ncbi:MAG TPA: hypothetical protein VMB71_16570 [Acetobacteraceae bacterium]|nr:hypothetical protein [Acetobacteraceae bacterium]
MWIAGLLPPLFLVSIVTLALSGMETPRAIRTLSRASLAEQRFERRSLHLQTIGFSTAGLAFILGAVIGVQMLG